MTEILAFRSKYKPERPVLLYSSQDISSCNYVSICVTEALWTLTLIAMFVHLKKSCQSLWHYLFYKWLRNNITWLVDSLTNIFYEILEIENENPSSAPHHGGVRGMDQITYSFFLPFPSCSFPNSTDADPIFAFTL